MNSGQFMEGNNMSIEICKFDRYIYDDDAEIIASVGVSSERKWYQYFEPAVNELNLCYFKNECRIKKCNQEAVMKELELLNEWVEHNVDDNTDRKYLKTKIQNIQKFIPEALQEEKDILYIF